MMTPEQRKAARERLEQAELSTREPINVTADYPARMDGCCRLDESGKFESCDGCYTLRQDLEAVATLGCFDMDRVFNAKQKNRALFFAHAARDLREALDEIDRLEREVSARDYVLTMDAYFWEPNRDPEIMPADTDTILRLVAIAKKELTKREREQPKTIMGVDLAQSQDRTAAIVGGEIREIHKIQNVSLIKGGICPKCNKQLAPYEHVFLCGDRCSHQGLIQPGQVCPRCMVTLGENEIAFTYMDGCGHAIGAMPQDEGLDPLITRLRLLAQGEQTKQEGEQA